MQGLFYILICVVHMYECVCTYIHMCYPCIHTCMPTCIYTYICIDTTHICTYVYMHTYVYIHVHAYRGMYVFIQLVT